MSDESGKAHHEQEFFHAITEQWKNAAYVDALVKSRQTVRNGDEEIRTVKNCLTNLHHCTMVHDMNRLTISLDDDLYCLAKAHAFATKSSISKAIGDLLRKRNLNESVGSVKLKKVNAKKFHPVSGFPIVQGNGKKFTQQQILSAIHDDLPNIGMK